MRAAHTRAIEALRKTIEFLKDAPLSSGVCCCGDNMDGHPSPLNCGHSPTDSGQYAVTGLIDDLSTALAAVDAEPCACKDRPLSQCPGEWEPGCDLGRNEKYVVPVQEPVAWRFKVKVWIGGDIFETQWRATTHNDGRAGLEPLYTTPPAPKRQPLTDEQIARLVLQTVYEGDASTPHRDAWATEIGIPFARAIEKAHGIGSGA